MDCRIASHQIILLLYGDLGPAERLEIERHTESCRECGMALAEERRLQAILSQRPVLEPSAQLLARCRQELTAAIAPAETRRTPAARHRAAGALRSLAWPHRLWTQARFTPAFAAALLAVGFFAGYIAMGRVGVGRDLVSETPGLPAKSDSVATHIRSLAADPDTGQIVLTYDATWRDSVRGPIDDPRIRQMLLTAARQERNAGLRLDAIDLLRRQADDPEVRAVLVRAIGDDHNPGARLKAIDALQERTRKDRAVREAFLGALLQDVNPGVRVHALDALARAPHPETIDLFERLAREDSNDYVRLRSAAVVEAAYRTGD